ncbi:MAG: hypothetical protein K6E27_14430 [Eubacterium sp.]|nr:hypothetical protein [Eubacterium sp.]
MGDGGYLDSFRALKQQVDRNYKEYKRQYSSIEERKAELKSEVRSKKRIVLMILFAPLILFGFVEIFVLLGSRWGFFGIFYFIFVGLMMLSIGVGILGMLFPAIRNYLNASFRYKLLMNEELSESIKKKFGVITFSDEEIFLLSKISSIDEFYRRVKLEGLDKGESYKLVDCGEMTDYAREVLDDMRSKSLFVEYRATNANMRREAGYEWVVIGFAIIVSIFIVVITFKYK